MLLFMILVGLLSMSIFFGPTRVQAGPNKSIKLLDSSDIHTMVLTDVDLPYQLEVVEELSIEDAEGFFSGTVPEGLIDCVGSFLGSPEPETDLTVASYICQFSSMEQGRVALELVLDDIGDAQRIAAETAGYLPAETWQFQNHDEGFSELQA